MAQEDISKRNAQERTNDLTRKCGEYQKLINELSSEIQRLNEILKARLQENSVLENKMQYITG
jgi:predicted  nucleic acid-binding Zn-ribbon protein